MAFDVGSVVAKVKADITDFKKGIDDAKSQATGLGSHLSQIGTGIADFGKKAAVFTGLATAGIVAFGKASVDAYNESNLAYTQQLAVLRSTHNAAGVTLRDLREQAAALQNVTMFSDDAVAAGQNLLLTFTSIKGDVFKSATETILDMSQALGQDLKSSAIQLGKALNDPIQGVTALRRVGVSFNEEQLKQIETMQKSGDIMGAQKLILKELQTEFGGSAKAAGETFAGQMEILKNKINDVQETIGGVIATTIQFVGALFGGKGDVEAFAEAISELTGIDLSQAQSIGNFISGVVDRLKAFGEWIAANKDLVMTFLTGLAIAFGALMVIGTITALITALTNPITLVVAAITLLYTAWQTNFLGIRDATQFVVDALMILFNNVLMPIISAVKNFVVEHWNLIKTSTQFTFDLIVGIIKIAFNIISGVFLVMLNLLTGNWAGAWEVIKDKAANIWEVIKNIFNSAKNFIGAWGEEVKQRLIQPFEDAWNKIQDTVRKIKDALDFTKRHSPSIMDVLNRSVDLVNKAFGDLEIPTIPTPQLAVSGIGGGSTSSQQINITIPLDGAIVGDLTQASEFAEKIGDTIIKKLQGNIRF